MEERSPADDIIAEQTTALDNLMAYYGDLHRADLVCLDPDDYFDRQLDLKPFKEPKDKSKRQASKDAGVTLLLQLHSVFSKEAKARLAERTAKADALQREYSEAHARNVEEERTFYQRQQERHNQQVGARRHSFLIGNPEEVMAYFDQVLSSDSFTLELDPNRQGRRYESCTESLEYDPDKKELVVRYRIPDLGEICTIGSFVDNKKEQTVEAKELPAKKAGELRKHVLHAILIRASAEVFYSDPFGLVSRLVIVGFLDFYDPAYGTRRVIDAIKTAVPEKEFCQVDLGRADPEALFDRLFTKTIAAGLYKKESYQLKAIKDPKETS
ncbi:MAG: hypothetical protein LKI67_10615 [Olsenella sp.]|jgi:hypothetical protein|nr:hypothetical protein [Olsenella sp.]MCI1793682.1 hypothetical protein [Olsenella sp.]MCI1812285.1 hypothetical protein [Olsenella sp.]MCI1879104.1 hypothetical protein [Olsenella sp.]